MLGLYENLQRSIKLQEEFIDHLSKVNAELGIEKLRLTVENGDLKTTTESQSREIKTLNQHVADQQGLIDRLRALNEELRSITGGRGSGHMENGKDGSDLAAD